MSFNYNNTVDRVVVKKKCLVKGRITEKCRTFDASEQIIHILYWARDAVEQIEVFVDEASIRPLRDEERKGHNDGIGDYG